MNPENEWVITQHKDLRIVSDELWERCETLKQRYKKQPKRRKYLINPLRGLVFCGICSSQKNLANKERYVCSNYRQYRTCSNARGMNRSEILEHVFERLGKSLARFISKDSFENFCKISNPDAVQELKDVNETINSLVSFIGQRNIHMDELTHKLDELNKRRHELTQETEVSTNQNQSNIPSILQTALNALQKELGKVQDNDSNYLLLKALIESIVLTPTDKRTGESITITLKKNGWYTFYNLVQNQK